MNSSVRTDLARDLFLPTLLFVALGGMTWAVRGCSGYGAAVGCIFAGVAWGAGWWFISRSGSSEPVRRYTSAWIVLAVAVGFGFSGARGWMQWPSFFEGKIQITGPGDTLPISRTYGFVWLFIAGVPWAGLGACLLAWCGSLRETRFGHWVIRIACGLAGALVAQYLFDSFPQYFLPLYESLEDRYHDLEHNNNLRRLINDSRAAIRHLGIYLGLLGFEMGRRDWKNVVLISTVGLVNGAGWSLCQNWKWAPGIWPSGNFNWWRCWESSGGLSIGLALGIAYFLVNRPMSEPERTIFRTRRSIAGPNFEWLLVYLGLAGLMSIMLLSLAGVWGILYTIVIVLFGPVYLVSRSQAYAGEPTSTTSPYGDPNLQRLGLYLGLLFGLGISIRSGLKGWFNIYQGNEEYWSGVLWWILGPIYLVGLIALCLWTVRKPLPRDFDSDLFPHAAGLMWLVLIVQNVLGQLVTGPLDQWNEMAFSIYYLLLFAITAVIVVYYTAMQRLESPVGETVIEESFSEVLLYRAPERRR